MNAHCQISINGAPVAQSEFTQPRNGGQVKATYVWAFNLGLCRVDVTVRLTPTNLEST
jgi:hypothetical protein